MRFGVKGIFKMETFFLEPKSWVYQFYEARIINVEAESNIEAYEKAFFIFSEDQWEALQPAHDIEIQKQKFLGISRICELGEYMETYEVWYEYIDECPSTIIASKDDLCGQVQNIAK